MACAIEGVACVGVVKRGVAPKFGEMWVEIWVKKVRFGVKKFKKFIKWGVA